VIEFFVYQAVNSSYDSYTDTTEEPEIGASTIGEDQQVEKYQYDHAREYVISFLWEKYMSKDP